MRKRLKKKKRSCALCKPHKMGKALRRKPAVAVPKEMPGIIVAKAAKSIIK